MPKFTRHINKHRKNISFKKGGYNNDRERIIDESKDTTSNLLNTTRNNSLNHFGLEGINDNINKNIENVRNIQNKFDKGKKAILGTVNGVLDSDIVDNKVKDTAKDTAQIIGKLASRFNEAMDDPAIKYKIEKSIQNVGELSDIAVESFKEPFKKGVNDLIETVNESAPKFGKAVGKAAWDTVTSIPPISVVGDLINITNDVTKAASAAVDAGSEAIITASNTFIETRDNIKKILKELDERKKMAEQITNRTTNSIRDFENPLANTMRGGRKSRRKVSQNSKTKRAKFAT